MIRYFALLSLSMLIACPGGDSTKDSDSGTDTATDTATLVDFSCGEETCTAGAQYCLSESGGAYQDTSDVPHCVALPAACTTTLTCACLSASDEVPSGGECTDDGSGGLYVTVNYP